MTREEMLQELYKTNVAAELIALPSEMALECICVTSQGYAYKWLPLGQWPASVIKFENCDQLQSVQEKILENSLTLPEIEGTALYHMLEDLLPDCFSDDVESSLDELLSNFADVDLPNDGKIYVLCSAEDRRPHIKFFSDYKQFENAFCDAVVEDITPWETLSDEELEDWFDRTRMEFDGIPCSEYDE